MYIPLHYLNIECFFYFISLSKLFLDLQYLTCKFTAYKTALN